MTSRFQNSLHFVGSDEGLCAFEVRRSARRTVGLQIGADGQLLVRAPQRVSMREIRSILRRKQDWIVRKREEVARENQRLRQRRQQAASQRYFLGESYALRLERGTPETVQLGRSTLDVSVASMEPGRVSQVLNDWYGMQARAILPDFVAACLKDVAHLDLGEPAWRFRRMRTRWGSCSSRGQITLNTELVKAPPRCIEYIVLHELCHLRELNHGPRFYALMDEVMQDWREHSRLLDELGALF